MENTEDSEDHLALLNSIVRQSRKQIRVKVETNVGNDNLLDNSQTSFRPVPSQKGDQVEKITAIKTKNVPSKQKETGAPNPVKKVPPTAKKNLHVANSPNKMVGAKKGTEKIPPKFEVKTTNIIAGSRNIATQTQPTPFLIASDLPHQTKEITVPLLPSTEFYGRKGDSFDSSSQEIGKSSSGSDSIENIVFSPIVDNKGSSPSNYSQNQVGYGKKGNFQTRESPSIYITDKGNSLSPSVLEISEQSPLNRFSAPQIDPFEDNKMKVSSYGRTSARDSSTPQSMSNFVQTSPQRILPQKSSYGRMTAKEPQNDYSRNDSSSVHNHNQNSFSTYGRVSPRSPTESNTPPNGFPSFLPQERNKYDINFVPIDKNEIKRSTVNDNSRYYSPSPVKETTSPSNFESENSNQQYPKTDNVRFKIPRVQFNSYDTLVSPTSSRDLSSRSPDSAILSRTSSEPVKQKFHAFKASNVNSYEDKCAKCNNHFVGFSNQCYKCSSCGIEVHRKCLTAVLNNFCEGTKMATFRKFSTRSSSQRSIATNPISLETDIVHSGVLKKQGKMTDLWVKRFYVLKGNILWYFESELPLAGKAVPLGGIMIRNATILDRVELGPVYFEIRRFEDDEELSSIFQANNGPEKDRWIRYLESNKNTPPPEDEFTLKIEHELTYDWKQHNSHIFQVPFFAGNKDPLIYFEGLNISVFDPEIEYFRRKTWQHFSRVLKESTRLRDVYKERDLSPKYHPVECIKQSEVQLPLQIKIIDCKKNWSKYFLQQHFTAERVNEQKVGMFVEASM